VESGIIRNEIKTPHFQENMMVLSNLSSKTRLVEVKEDPLFLPENLKKGHEAAQEILSLLSTKLHAPDGSPHAPTILFAAAWLTGISLYRFFQEKKISSLGTVVTLQDVNREWDALVYLLEEYNFQRADVPIGRVVLAAMAAPRSFKPQIGVSDVQAELQTQYNTVIEKHGFDSLEGARVGVILCSLLIQQYSQAGMIDAEAATGVAAQGIFEAARQCLFP
jgi:hypothetical protein